MIASLAVALTAQTGQFSSKLQGASKDVNAFMGRVQTAGAKITKAFQAIIVPVGLVAGIGAMVKATADAVEENVNLAAKLQTTYNEMVALTVGAKNAGGSIEGMAKAMESLQERLGDGDKGALEALNKLGLSAQQLTGKGAFQQIQMIATAFQNLASAEQKAAIGKELFGKASRELNVFLSEGTEELRKNLDYIERTGLALNDVGANKVKVLGDSLDDLFDSFKGLGQQLLLFTSGALTALVNGLSELVQVLVAIPRALNDIFSDSRRLRVAMNLAALFGDRDVANALAEDMHAAEAIESAPGAFQGQKMQDAMRKRDTDIQTKAGVDLIGSLLGSALGKGQQAAGSIFDNLRKRQEERNLMRPNVELFMKGVEIAIPLMKRAFGNAGDYLVSQRKIDAAYASVNQGRMAAAMDPRAELGLSGFYDGMKPNSAVSDAASAGTRGTFSSDNAGRSLQTVTIQKAQLDTLQSINDHLENIDDNGVVANAG